MDALRGKRALVMGLGINAGGLGVTRFLVEQGAEVTVTDLRDEQVLAPTLEALAGLPVRYVLGRHDEADFRETDLVVRNPGVPRESRFLQIAREHGAAIEMEMTLFFRLCRGTITGITGTRGKTTTTLMTGALLHSQFPDTVVAGNLRISALEQLPRIQPGTPVVLELSSWQLEGLGEAGLSPQVACVTNLSPDHLDRYHDMHAYGLAKQQIFLHQQPERGDRVVLCADDPTVWEWRSAIVPGTRLAAFSTRRHPDETPGDLAWWDGDRLMWNEEQICSSDDLRVKGEHNRANAAAAVALARLFTPPVAADKIVQGLHTFHGVADRQELVREIDGVAYINDTTATTPTATIAALRAIDRPVILIAGGADKGLAFDELAAEMGRRMLGGRRQLKAVVLLDGTATSRLAQALDSHGIATEPPFPALAPALHQAQQLASDGDVVLLSPACASFGMFRNEFDRGEQFRRLVETMQ